MPNNQPAVCTKLPEITDYLYIIPSQPKLVYTLHLKRLKVDETLVP